MSIYGIIRQVAYDHDVRYEDILSDCRRHKLTAARKEITRRALQSGFFQIEIADALGRTHSTIWYYQTQINKEVPNANSITPTK